MHRFSVIVRASVLLLGPSLSACADDADDTVDEITVYAVVPPPYQTVEECIASPSRPFNCRPPLTRMSRSARAPSRHPGVCHGSSRPCRFQPVSSSQVFGSHTSSGSCPGVNGIAGGVFTQPPKLCPLANGSSLTPGRARL